jgi:hypothetical protein
MRTTRFIPVLLLVLAPMALGASNGASSRPPVVLIHMRSSSAVDEQVLQSLLVDSVTLELSDRGMEVLTGTVPARTSDDILDLARREEADFALVGIYTLKDKQVLLEIQWLDVRRRALAAQASRHGPLDLSFDSIVADAVDELLSGQAGSFANLPPRTVKPEEHVSAPSARAGSREAPLDLLLPVPEPEAAARAVEPAREPLPAARAPADSPPAAPLRRFALSLGAAPLIATFNAAKYFSTGVAIQLAGQYRIRASGGFLGFGLATAAHGFHGKGTYVEADFLLLPIGAEVQYGTRTGTPIDFFVHVNGGPAVFAVRMSGGNPLAKVIPYVAGGVGVTVSMGDGLGVSLDGSYAAFFDSPLPIMGYTPSVSFLVRL